jgi:hypothetical protein
MGKENRAMLVPGRFDVNRRFTLPAIVALCCGLSGCGGSQSANVALNNALATTGSKKETTARFAGNVTIDGGSPGNLGVVRTIVVLWNLNTPPKGLPPYAVCDEDGNFEFHTYEKNDGVEAGKYAVCFVQLEGGIRIAGPSGWRGPDKLHDLYSDPDKNKDVKELVVDLAPPGNPDWHYDLRIADQEPVTNPGPNAIKGLH